MTEQEIFNIAYAGLKSQGFQQSIHAGNPWKCLYRGAHNMKCAIGYLIPDEKYQPVFETVTVRLIMKEIRPELEDKTIKFMLSLQKVHDLGDSPDEMVTRLKRFAKLNELEFPDED